MKKIREVAHKRWSTKEKEETIDDMKYISEPTIDTVNPSHEQTIDQEDHSQEQVDEVGIDIVKHDHQYVQSYEKACIYDDDDDDDGIDVHEVEIDDTTMLPKKCYSSWLIQTCCRTGTHHKTTKKMDVKSVDFL